MDNLRNLMQLIDKNSGEIPEGDYLEMANILKTLYTKVERRSVPGLYNYNSDIIDASAEPLEDAVWICERYIDKAITTELHFCGSQLDYLDRQIKKLTPLRRTTWNLKCHAVLEYCRQNGVILYKGYRPGPEFEENLKLRGVTNDHNSFMYDLVKKYMFYENQFRRKTKNAMITRMRSIEFYMNKLHEY